MMARRPSITRQHIVVFTTDNGAETIAFPDGGTTPFKGGKLSTWEGGMRAPLLVRWPGTIRPGTVKNDIFASLGSLPTLVNIAGGDKGDALNRRIMAGSYPGHRQDQYYTTWFEVVARRVSPSARKASRQSIRAVSMARGLRCESSRSALTRGSTGSIRSISDPPEKLRPCRLLRPRTTTGGGHDKEALYPAFPG